MRFFRSPVGAVLTLALVVAVGGCAFAWMRVHRATHPPRHDQVAVDFDSVLMRVEDVSFPSTDGVELAGWRLRGRPAQPTVILCHDNGASKSSLVNLAIALGEAGFDLLLFDFRAHGESGGARSTLGAQEKRDVLGAIDFVGAGAERPRQIGIYAVGTGAHAAVLAALDRPHVRVLVLDRLYPDVGFALGREVFADWSAGARWFGFVPRVIHAATAGSGSQRASEAITHLVGRDVLLLAPERDDALREAMQDMYGKIPEQVDADGNLVFVEQGLGSGLYGEAQNAYHAQVREFFVSRLGAQSERIAVADGSPGAGQTIDLGAAATSTDGG